MSHSQDIEAINGMVRVTRFEPRFMVNETGFDIKGNNGNRVYMNLTVDQKKELVQALIAEIEYQTGSPF